MKASYIAAVLIGLMVLSMCSAANAAQESKKFFPPDAPNMPAYSLPDLLVAADGHKITTPEDWKRNRRPEILELFRNYVYGRVPATPYQQTFKTIKEDPRAMVGAATLKQIDIGIRADEKSLTIHMSLFVPNKARKPAPAFLLICNRSPDNIDPTRKSKSEFWPAEEVIARGYAIAAFYNADVDPDKDDNFKDGIHGMLDGGTRPADAWGTLPPGPGGRAGAWITWSRTRTSPKTRSL